MIVLNKDYTQQLIYDGEEVESIKFLSLSGETSIVRFSELNYFNDLTKLLEKDEWEIIKESMPQIKESKYFPDAYSGTDNLPLMFFLNKHRSRYFVFSIGEFQPARYKAYLELAFEII